MKIRQEINLLVSSLTGTGTVNSNEQFLFLPDIYGTNVSFIFEACYNGAASNTGKINLVASVGGTVAQLTGATSTTYVCNRTTFTLPAATFSNTTQVGALLSVSLAGDGSRSQTLHSARIIVLQSDSPLEYSQTVWEIGLNASFTNTTSAQLAPGKYWTYTAANYDSTPTQFYCSVLWLNSSSKTTCSISLEEDNGSFAGWTSKNNIVPNTFSTTKTEWASKFTPVDGRHYRVTGLSASSKSNFTIYNFRIVAIVGQVAESIFAGTGGNNRTSNVPTSSFNLQNASNSGTLDHVLFNTQVTDTVWIDTINVYVCKVGSPVDSLTCDLCVNGLSSTSPSDTVSITGSSLPTGLLNWTVFTFPTGVNFSSNSTPYFVFSRTGATDTTNYYKFGLLPQAQGSYSTRSGTTNNAVSNQNMLYFFGNQNTSTATPPNNNITDLELAYNMAPISDTNATGVQNQLTVWNSTDWDAGSAGTIVYKTYMSSDNASNSIKLRDITASADLTNSTVTGANEQIGSSNISGLVSGNKIDVWVLNTTGTITNSGMIVIFSYSAVASVTVFIPWIEEDFAR